ncbi:MFS transporter [Yokenella regensburgei]
MPAVIPLITSILPKENFVLANSTIDIAYEIGTVSGMAASGVLIALVGGTGTLMCGGVIFCISTCAILAIKYIEPDKVRKKKQGIVGEYLAALKYLLTIHSLLGLYVVQTFVNILLMTIPIMLVPYVREILHGGPGVFSAFESAYSAGILVGCFGVVQMSQRWGFKKSAMGLITGVCAGLAILAASTSIALSLCAYFVAGICLSCWSLVLSQTQEKTDLQFQGRLQSLSSSLSGMFILAIYLVLTFRSNWIGIAQLYYVQAVCAGAVVILLGLMMQQKSLR